MKTMINTASVISDEAVHRRMKNATGLDPGAVDATQYV